MTIKGFVFPQWPMVTIAATWWEPWAKSKKETCSVPTKRKWILPAVAQQAILDFPHISHANANTRTHAASTARSGLQDCETAHSCWLVKTSLSKRCACVLRSGRMGTWSLPKALRGGGSGASERVVFSSPASGRLSPPSNIPATATV